MFLSEESFKWLVFILGIDLSWCSLGVLCPLFFLICIKDLSYGLSSTTKLFANVISFFSDVHVTQSTNELNNDLGKISNWTDLWKISFNPGKYKQSHEVRFSRITQKVNLLQKFQQYTSCLQFLSKASRYISWWKNKLY